MAGEQKLNVSTNQEEGKLFSQGAFPNNNESVVTGGSQSINRRKIIAQLNELTRSKSQPQELEAAPVHARQDSAICIDDSGNRKGLDREIRDLYGRFFAAQKISQPAIPQVIVTPGTSNNRGSLNVPGNVDGTTDVEFPRNDSGEPSPRQIIDFWGGSTSQIGFSSNVSSPELKCDAHLETDDVELWDDQPLLELSNTWRQNLSSGIFPEPNELEMMDNIMKEFLTEPNDNQIDFEVIMRAKLDKLIQAIISAVDEYPRVEERFKDVAKKAALVERRWQKRFKGRLFIVNDERKRALYADGGSLSHLSLRRDLISANPEWITDTVQKSPTANFEPGDWWLNLTCAYRDGVISNDKGKFLASAKDTPTVCLFKGSEKKAADPLTTKFVHEGSIKEMQLGLMTYFHKPVRILRGHRLQSIYAPAAGIRYDGMYLVRTYSHKRISMEDDLFRVEITIERVENQRPFAEIDNVPTPSQLDDWELYLKIIDEDVKRRLDTLEYDKWRKKEQFEEAVKSEWLRQESFKASLKGE